MVNERTEFLSQVKSYSIGLKKNKNKTKKMKYLGGSIYIT